MPDLRPQKHPLGFDVRLPYKLFRDGHPFDLTGYTITLKFLASDGTTTFDKTSASDSDWVAITDAEEGEFDIIIDEAPSTIAVDDAHKVGVSVGDGTNTYRAGKIPSFEIYTPPEGAY
jgi:hypothetical protein